MAIKINYILALKLSFLKQNTWLQNDLPELKANEGPYKTTPIYGMVPNKKANVEAKRTVSELYLRLRYYIWTKNKVFILIWTLSCLHLLQKKQMDKVVDINKLYKSSCILILRILPLKDKSESDCKSMST